MARPMVELLAQLQVHPVLRYLTLDGSTTFVCLVADLKHNILQPQPINSSMYCIWHIDFKYFRHSMPHLFVHILLMLQRFHIFS